MPMTSTSTSVTNSGTYCTGQSWSSSTSLITKVINKSSTIKGDHKTPLPYFRIEVNSPVSYMTTRRLCGYGYPPGSRSVSRTAINLVKMSSNSFSIFAPTIALPASANSQATMAMFSDLSGDKAQIGLALAEYRKTAAFIGDTLTDIATLVRDIKRGRFSKAFRRLVSKHDRKITTKNFGKVGKTAAERWLQWNFAVKPLMGDVSSSIEVISKRTWSPPDFYLAAQGRASFTIPGSTSSTNRSHSVDSVTTGGVKIKGYWRVTQPELFAASTLGVGPADLAAIAWDIVPFSFVFDWFFKVNTWIKQLTATQGLTYVHGFRTVWFKQSFSKTEWHQPGSDTLMDASSSGSAKGFQRSVLPRPTFALPRYTGGQSYWHLITSASLLAVLYKPTSANPGGN